MPDHLSALRRVVTRRAENFGGYLFIPGAMEPLNSAQRSTYGAYCNGLHTVASITAEMASVARVGAGRNAKKTLGGAQTPSGLVVLEG
jgi:hypothetical protein